MIKILVWCNYCKKRIKKKENSIILWHWKASGDRSYTGSYHSHIYHKWCGILIRKKNQKEYLDYNPEKREKERKKKEIQISKREYFN